MDKNVPIKLYKYRKIIEYDINALLKFELWGATGSAMQDHRDCGVIANESKCTEFLKGKMKPKYIEEACSQLLKSIDDYFRSSRYIISLCEDKNVERMWNEYSENHTGFVIEYETKDIIEQLNHKLDAVYQELSFSSNLKNPQKALKLLRKNDLGFYKVNYTDEPFDVTDEVLIKLGSQYKEVVLKETISWDYNVEHYINQEILKRNIVTSKKNEFSYEKEWRVVIPSLYKVLTIEAAPILKVKPRKIIVGSNATLENVRLMSDISRKLDIDLEFR